MKPPQHLRDATALDPQGAHADWWDASVSLEEASRGRETVRALLAVGGIVVAHALSGCDFPTTPPAFTGGGVTAEWAPVAATATAPNAPPPQPPPPPPGSRVAVRPSIELQEQYGWNAGTSASELRPFGTPEAFDPALMDTLPERLAPSRADLAPFYVATLFESVARSTNPDSGSRAILRGQIAPSGGREQSFQAGRALAALPLPAGTAVIIDLPGPDAVAYAAGLASGPDAYDPVFVFDNWPHPYGIVPAHATLEAALHYTPVFEKRARSEGAIPVFVLDRNRLVPYQNDSRLFDNRYVAHLPSAQALRALGINRVVYVFSYGNSESDDLNATLVEYDQAGIPIDRAVPFIPGLIAGYRPQPRCTMFDPCGMEAGGVEFGTTQVVIDGSGIVQMVLGSGGTFFPGWGGGGSIGRGGWGGGG